jgi:hypothetical protein
VQFCALRLLLSAVQLHIGDFAYNADELEGVNGDLFFEELTNVTSRVPYMGVCGNHERAYNFTHYAHRFSNWNYIGDPAGAVDQNWWHSYDLVSGGATTHYIGIDTELYYFRDADPHASPAAVAQYMLLIEHQYDRIKADLIEAADSGRYDWIVAYGHRPMYCRCDDTMHMRCEKYCECDHC